jgi:hypothetical protein
MCRQQPSDGATVRLIKTSKNMYLLQGDEVVGALALLPLARCQQEVPTIVQLHVSWQYHRPSSVPTHSFSLPLWLPRLTSCMQTVSNLKDELICCPQRAHALAQDATVQRLIAGPWLVHKLPAGYSGRFSHTTCGLQQGIEHAATELQ